MGVRHSLTGASSTQICSFLSFLGINQPNFRNKTVFTQLLGFTLNRPTTVLLDSKKNGAPRSQQLRCLSQFFGILLRGKPDCECETKLIDALRYSVGSAIGIDQSVADRWFVSDHFGSSGVVFELLSNAAHRDPKIFKIMLMPCPPHRAK